MTSKVSNAAAQAQWRIRHPDRNRLSLMINNARIRAKQTGLPFSITKYGIVIPEVCPVLGKPLQLPTGDKRPGDWSPSLDRVIPELGYVPGNVRVISYRANRIRNDASLEELEAVVAFLKG